jgi:hypothetical protein
VTLREKLIGEFDDPQGELQGFVTRNHTGAEVLNIKNVMFLDWDTTYTAPSLGTTFAILWNGIKRLFGMKSKPAPEILTPDVPMLVNPRTGAGLGNTTVCRQPDMAWENRTPESWEQTYPWAAVPELSAFMQWVSQQPDWGVRIYKTCAGYRGLVTHALFDPTADATLDLMRQFRCDPQYVALCKRQESFRARMTPKGWRCKLWGNSLNSSFRFHYPARDLVAWDEGTPVDVIVQLVNDALAEYDVIYDDAVQAYEQASADYATCRYLGTVGNETMHPNIAPIVGLHDEMTKALSETEMLLA